jgi:DNA-binding beta-propeller fold protein YncE
MSKPRRAIIIRRWAVLLVLLGVIALGVTALSKPDAAKRPASAPPPDATTNRSLSAPVRTSTPLNVYAADTSNDLSPVVRRDVPLIYVPNSESSSVTEIDPRTGLIVRTFAVGAEPQHVVPSWDLRTLWVTSDIGNSLTPINPVNGIPGPPVPVEDPYNMYFTPDGRYAIVVAERLQRLDFRQPHTMALFHSLSVPCPGVDHMDFSADGSYLIATCEFGARLLKVNVAEQKVVSTLNLPGGGMPQDVKLSPDGRVFYVADMQAGGVWELDGDDMRLLGFIPTGREAHGLYVSRDFKYLYVTNRGEGSISLIDLQFRREVTKWVLPGGGSPDMGNVSVDGSVLWLSGRYNAEVYAIDTHSGKLLLRIPVGAGPHGLCVWPQPGRYSLGHTGIMR